MILQQNMLQLYLKEENASGRTMELLFFPFLARPCFIIVLENSFLKINHCDENFLLVFSLLSIYFREM